MSASASDDKTLRVWDLRRGEAVGKYSMHVFDTDGHALSVVRAEETKIVLLHGGRCITMELAAIGEATADAGKETKAEGKE